jgi:argininosuccinate synthase
MSVKKVVLAYSGGLDTSIIIPWLKETYNCEVVAVAINVGQGEELEPLHEKAKASGASKLYIEDVRDEFVTDYIWPMLKAGAVYEGSYLLGTSIARPLIAKKIIEIANKENADAVCHGCTGKGNDQVRFELTFRALKPDVKIIAPWREWDIKSRQEQIEYARVRGIDVPVTKEKPYSMDRNLWHLSHEGADLEDPWNEPKDDLYLLTCPPEKAPDEPTYVEVTFERGIPVALDGERLDGVTLIEKLNKIAGENGVGISDLVENRLVGMKSRGVYETPGGTVLYAAHNELEQITLDRFTMHYKELIAAKYAELVYNGFWFTTLRRALDAFVDETQKNVTGTVRMKLYKGSCTVAGRKADRSLYREDLATFGEDQVYDQKDSEGFIKLLGLPLWVEAMVDKEN